MKKTPKLRFSEFSGCWDSKKVASVFDRVSNKVDVIKDEYYKQIGIRSHGKGIFYKDPVSGEELGNKRVFWVEPNVFVVNIVFAWEQAIARTTQNEVGMIASHRFPMYKPKENILDLDYVTQLFKTPKGKSLLSLASPGGAGRNKTLGQKEFDDLEIVLPSYKEQKKISNFISLIDRKIIKQGEKFKSLKDYKKGIMQKIFSDELQFKDNNGNKYPLWKEHKLGNLCSIKTGKLDANAMTQDGKYAFFTCSKEVYKTNEYAFEGESLLIAGNGDMGSVKYYNGKFNAYQRTYVLKDFECSTLYMKYFIEKNLPKQIYKNTNFGAMPYITLNVLADMIVFLPVKEEQEKIAEFLSNIDYKIEKEKEKLDFLNEYKKGLLQQMFV